MFRQPERKSTSESRHRTPLTRTITLYELLTQHLDETIQNRVHSNKQMNRYCKPELMGTQLRWSKQESEENTSVSWLEMCILEDTVSAKQQTWINSFITTKKDSLAVFLKINSWQLAEGKRRRWRPQITWRRTI